MSHLLWSFAYFAELVGLLFLRGAAIVASVNARDNCSKYFLYMVTYDGCDLMRELIGPRRWSTFFTFVY